MTEAIVWLIGYPLSLILFLFLGITSLVYNKVKNEIAEEEFQQFISRLRFPVSIITNMYNNEEVRNFVLPPRRTKGMLQVNRFLWLFVIALFFWGLIADLFPGSLYLRGFWIVAYIFLVPIGWRLGHTLDQS